MKKVAVFIAILLFSISMAENLVTVRKLENGLEVEERFITYVLNSSGDIGEIYLKVFGRKTKIYEHSNDGFDLTLNGTKLSCSLSSIDGEEKTDVGYTKKVRVKYTCGDIVKEYTFINGPAYNFEVRVNGRVQISLPRVWSSDTDGFSRGIFVSYAPKGKYVAIVLYDKGEIFGNVLKYPGGTLRVYIGPSKKTLIKKAMGDEYDSIMGILDKLGAYGWYDTLFYGLVWFFYWLYDLTGNFGWTIIIFTFVVRLVLYPMYHAQTKSMIKLRKIQKDVEYIRKKYKDPKKQQEELMRLYKEKGVNPAGGCLLMLVQLPIFFMLWGVIRYFEEEFAFGKPFLIWKDLSVGGFKANIILVLITIIAGYYNTLVTSQDTRSAWQGIAMSVIFPFIFISLPSGLLLYYATNTLIQLVVTYYIYKRYHIKGITTRELLGLPRRS